MAVLEASSNTWKIWNKSRAKHETVCINKRKRLKHIKILCTDEENFLN